MLTLQFVNIVHTAKPKTKGYAGRFLPLPFLLTKKAELPAVPKRGITSDNRTARIAAGRTQKPRWWH